MSEKEFSENLSAVIEERLIKPKTLSSQTNRYGDVCVLGFGIRICDKELRRFAYP